ncbi:MAG: 23S rRNA (guanosine(2251)-2'-O)-methyltransferase RlmB [Ignavibacteria bacterium]|nr:23S rRNA (guanosine(2251)-2'-O)-methyltransferase RlmB [Ignavibacteria bacterium]
MAEKLEKDVVIVGRNSVIEALRSGLNIEKIYVRFGINEKAIQMVFALSKQSGIPISVLDKEKFFRLEKENSVENRTQGIIAIVSKIQYFELEELIRKSYEVNPTPVLVLLDKIQDPQNLGAVARVIDGAGAEGLIIPLRSSVPVTSSAIRASSGALLHIRICKVGSLISAIQKLKDEGFWIVGASEKAERAYFELDYNFPLVLILGSEGYGISKSILKNCDYFVKIPMLGAVQSLNVSVSAGIILYEVRRQRGFYPSE